MDEQTGVNLGGHAWLMSLVQADFSCLEEATRMMVKDWPSLGSTTILKSRCSISWVFFSDFAAEKTGGNDFVFTNG